LTSAEIVETVEKLALAGWAPSTLAKFACSIEEVEDLTRNSNIATVLQTTESVATVGSATLAYDSSTESASTTIGVPASFVPVQTVHAKLEK
jgi:hypothetical protein